MDVYVTDGQVAIRWHERGALTTIDEDGRVGERFSEVGQPLIDPASEMGRQLIDNAHDAGFGEGWIDALGVIREGVAELLDKQTHATIRNYVRDHIEPLIDQAESRLS